MILIDHKGNHKFAVKILGKNSYSHMIKMNTENKTSRYCVASRITSVLLLPKSQNLNLIVKHQIS